MRILIINLLAAAVLLVGASTASAVSLYHQVRGGLSSYATSDTVTVDVFLNADTGITILGSAVVTDATILTYDPVASQAAPVIYAAPPASYGTNGSQPGYILYAGGMPATSLYPLQTPVWQTWPAPLDPATQQVNVNYAEPSFNTTSATGNDIWIGTLVYHVNQAFTSTSIRLSLTDPGNVVDAGGVVIGGDVLTAPIVITGHVPEPTTAALIGLGVLGLAVAGRRK